MSEKRSGGKPATKVKAARGSLIESKEAILGNHFTLTRSPFTDAQVLRLFARTPKQYVKKRPAKGGGEWEYVTGAYVQKILNFVFGFMWNFEVVGEDVQGDQVVVRGRLTINHMDQDDNIKPMIVKEQYGRADIKYKKDTKFMLDYGNDKKAAATDAFKKCASQLGIASDIYSKEEFKDIELPVDGDSDKTRPTGELNEKTKAALDALGIDKTNITTQEQATEAIKNTTAQKKAGAK